MIAPTSNPDRINIRAALKQGIMLLRSAHVPSDTLAAEVLLLHASGKDRTWLYTHPEEILDPEIRRRIGAAFRAYEPADDVGFARNVGDGAQQARAARRIGEKALMLHYVSVPSRASASAISVRTAAARGCAMNLVSPRA